MNFVILLCSVALAYSQSSYEWNAWKTQYNKEYMSQEEDDYRYDVWKDNLEYVTEQNKNITFELGMNQLADLTQDEYVNTYLGFRQTEKTNNATEFVVLDGMALPAEVDWRTKGYVTKVKNQGQCGSCWAFSATGSLEGQHFKKTGQLVSLSEQNLMDCSRKEGNKGCKGGDMELAFEYVKKNGGIDTEASYPYRGKNEKTCHYTAANRGATCTGFNHVPKEDENALQQAVATVGPISVGIDASHRSFQLYRRGVYYEKKCSQKKLDHGVLAVGYGGEGEEAYWLVKNSWGPHWGMAGYVQMSRDRENNCGIATDASYPLV